MTRFASTAKIVALSIAIVTHGAFALALVVSDEALIEGAGGASEVRLGSGFRNMAAGTLTAEHAGRVDPETSSETMRPEEPERAPQPSLETPIPAMPPVPIEGVEAELAARSVPDVPDGTLAAERPQAVLKETARPRTVAAKPDRLEGEDPLTTTVTRSLRPMPRSAEFVEAHKPAIVTKPTLRKPEAKASHPKANQGNAGKSARAGEATGTRDATARQSGSGGQKQVAGNAAVSNYPGLVMRRLSRAGKPRVTARGAAMVSFTIGSTGGLDSVSLARSSGSAALDQAAVRLVRGAGPFPKPPQGARRSFAIEIRGG